jgi:hypothetical protein
MAARELVGELLRLARQEENEIFQLEAHHAGWTTFTYLGDLETAIHHATQMRPSTGQRNTGY